MIGHLLIGITTKEDGAPAYRRAGVTSGELASPVTVLTSFRGESAARLSSIRSPGRCLHLFSFFFVRS